MLESFLDSLTQLSSLGKVLWLAAILTFFTVLERVIPYAREPYKQWPHAKTNLVFLLTTFIVNGVFSLVLVKLVPVLAAHKIGLFHWISLPVWAELLLALLLLDLLGQYTIHYLLHNVPALWRFHMVHHSDTHVDATTGTRHHPVDYVARETFSLLTVVALGVPMAYYLFYRLLTVPCTYFTHANISLPSWLDRAIALVFVTPYAHKFHHHQSHPWTDRNYGNILSVWDRLFGTFVYGDISKVRYGVDTMDGSQANTLRYQMLRPFQAGAGKRQPIATDAA